MTTSPFERSPLRRWARRASERGAVAVEFAFIMPVLFALVFGIVAFGILFSQHLALSNAAREGARFGSVNLYGAGTGSPHDCQAVVDSARRAADAIALDVADVAVVVERDDVLICGAPAGAAASTNATTTPCSGGSGASTLKVRLNYQSASFFSLLPIDSLVDLRAQGVFRCEYS